MNKTIKILGGLTFLLLGLVLMASAASATVTVSASPNNIPPNPILNSSNANLAAGAYVQVIKSTDNIASSPNESDGLPISGTDSVIATGTLSNPGTFTKGGVSIPVGQYIYIVAWETWNGVGKPSGKYGISNIIIISSPNQIYYPTISTTLQFNSAPNVPTSLIQYKADGTTVTAAGSWTNEHSFVAKFAVSDPNGGNVTPQVQYRVVGGSWGSWLAPVSGNPVASGATGSVTISSLSTNTQYEWQARTSDGRLTSSWVDYNNNAGVVDIKIDTTSPGAVTITAPSSPRNNSSLAFSWTAGSDAGSGLNATPYYYLLDSKPTATPATVRNSGTGTVNLNATVTGAAGNNYLHVIAVDAAGNLSTVANSTAVVLDTTAPTISSFNPANNASGVALAQNVVITFSEPVKTDGSFTYSWGAKDPGGTVVAWSNNNTVANVSHTAFANSTSYTFTITAASDVAGNAMAANNNATTFTTVAPNAPQIDGTSWEQNKDTGYTYGTLNLNGSKFGANQGGSSVELRFQGGQYFTLPNANVYYWSDGKIQIGIPQNVTANYAVAGNTDVRLTVNGQTASTTFVLKPKVYSVTPNSGPVGTKVVIEGTGFNPVAASNSVSFSGTPAAGTKVTQGTNVDTLEVTVPQGATTGQLLVTVNGQSSNTNFDWGNKDQIVFTVIVPGQQIDSTSWEQNKDTGYTYGTLNLNGSKFGANQGGSSVELRFQGGQYFTLPNANVYYWSDGKIQIGIPQNVTANYAVAGNTDVRLTVNGQTASTTFVLKPKVYSVTPNSGPVGTKVVIEGTGFNPVAASNSVGFSGTPAAGTKVTQGTNVDTLEVTVPQGATTGQLLVTVNGQSSNTNFDWGNKDQVVFTVVIPGQPTIISINPTSGKPGETLTMTIKGENNNWTGDMKAKVQVSGNDVTVNNATASDPNTIIASLTIAGNAAEGPRTISVNGAAGSATLTVSNQVNPGGPSVSTVLPSPATIGQTITISGSNLGDNMGASTVTIGGKTAKPTAWVKDSITVAVPTGVASGTAVVAVTVNGVTANSSVTIDTSKIMVDDFEGGDVGTFAAPAADSGYYVFDKYDAQYNANIKSSSYPDMAANTANPKAGQKSAELKYSYGSRSADPQYVGVNGDWGGGWGGKLANTLNLSGATKFGFQVRWDGSANDLNLAFKDSDGTVYTAAVSNGRLTPANASYVEIIVNPADFAADQYNKGVNPAMDWANITEYQVTYKSKNTAANKHYIDSVIAYLPGGNPGPNPVTGEAPVIGAITPSAAPAGTMITVTGSRFGSPQGSSTLTFTNKTTGVSYPADIVSWNDGTIQAIVPTKALAGDYEIKVKRESIAQGVVTAFESAPAAFQVTASAAEVATVYPNPFNAGTESVNISITNSANATNIGYYLYDMTARLVWKQVIATKQTTWDGRDIYSATVGDGAYILRVVNEDNKTLLAKGKILVVKH